ncbi:MAG: sensor histidine kinase [Oleispira sp.]|nr:sensor histidine kinase [Oleispira sp.]MBL4880242.1 sensor histidine kinase [Oleispira sp.]
MKKTVKTQQNFPFFSALAAVLLISYLFALVIRTEFEVLNAFLIKFPLFTQHYFSASMLVVFVLLLIFDLQRFHRQKKQVKRNTNKLKKEITDVWESKKHLQNKAHTYSGHADKLKLFISDKLLEYIEYDEKFLHFKGIAAEVRHNGVISYDIVTSLLTDLLKQGESSNSAEAKKALAAMRYLWDLLDLSTADNIALHIANFLINAEEQYYQMMLEKDDGELSPAIIKADFSSIESVASALIHLVHEPDSIDMALIDAIELPLPWSFQDDQFKIRVTSKQALLGNSNHVRLILENLLKNAQHFSRKVSFKQKTDRILLSVSEGPVQGHDDSIVSYIDFQVYNRGPQILDEHKNKLFQLGYSTRRTRDHHGKGLGLFFVNEIVKGYEGQLLLENINNQADSYSIRISLNNGDVDTQIVKVIVNESRPCIDIDGADENETSQRWQYSSVIESIEISSQKMNETVRFNCEGGYKKSESYVQENTLGSVLLPPCWSLDVQPKRGGNKTHNVIFNPLDISGVRFSIKLPTAQARLEGIEPDYVDSAGQDSSSAGFISDNDELAELQRGFKAPS